MARIMRPLEEMGARIEARDSKFPPLTIHGGKLHPIEYTLPVASAQVKSCVLLAGLYADGRTTSMSPCARAITPSWRCANSAQTWMSKGSLSA